MGLKREVGLNKFFASRRGLLKMGAYLKREA